MSDQFEVGEPAELPHRPRDLDGCQHWKSDPESGVTGVVYLAEDTVFYYAPDVPPGSGWWDIGQLPPALQAVD